MLVSWNWLKQYVTLDMPHSELETRLMMAGLNHESTTDVDGDLAIDIEVTSNRPDCLGHLGVAREISVLWGRELNIPQAKPKETGPAVEKLVQVRIDCPELCSRYTARVVRGVKIGPSPSWMVRRLKTIGIAAINNVVDISNYVLMECGQPLHTFDFAKLKGSQIIVRQPKPGETIEAIDHRDYRLEPGMCIIADGENPVAIGGVMGGASTEISPVTTDILVESADFDPLAIRGAARALNLHSDSSYRFERRVDPEGIDWASRRCCELILELAGGRLCQGVVDVGQPPPPRKPVVLRLDQIERVLGISVPEDEVRRILAALGNVETRADQKQVEVIPPSWRRDLSREIDLIEEVARIHGYEEIPEDVGVPMVASTRRHEDRVLAKVRTVLAADGFDEAMTASMVDAAAAAAFSPWSDEEPLSTFMPLLRGADRLRLSLIPSLLEARRTNESLSNPRIELFEIAKVYLPRGKKLPDEERLLALCSGRSFEEVKGAIEAIVAVLDPMAVVEAVDARFDLLAPDACCALSVAGKPLGVLGRLRPEALKRFDLRGETTVAEVKTSVLIEMARLVPRYAPLPAYPAVSRDLNLEVDRRVRWADVAKTVAAGSEPFFESLEYRETYLDAKRLGPDKKSLLMTLVLRSREGTMTNQQADELRERIVAACRREHGAELRA
ncbi:MAG TPA: phenylalanine--tRNA ligase subunit beta [Thermoguttaceae bacterium]|nr:phenylalanine--tRNA ligase subunit beta [Thermoguttaceae bacterium]